MKLTRQLRTPGLGLARFAAATKAGLVNLILKRKNMPLMK
jgi:hypothetical protein